MCGRYVFYDGKNPRFQNWISLLKEKMTENDFQKLSFEDIHPTDKSLVGLFDPQERHLKTILMTWGFLTKKNLVINARCETCFTSPFFAQCLPCTIPCSGYYEWTTDKQKYLFQTKEEMYLGGLCKKEKDGWHFVILTEEATGKQAHIHSRQPLVFTREDAKKWNLSKDPTSLYSCSIQNRTQMKI